ncbi:MAG: NAD-dependent epimerase/dehydratase family protein [Deltaproteobacteria bacterium]|jgi:nucleoside-diphosphate-sugar epimerase|nr:NAD-dependent epimerase/dehydratase family protein [Deltaproteobacteria bacterium]
MKSEHRDMIYKDCEQVTANSVHLLSALRGQCILITGGTGFVGTWLAEMITFLNDNHDFNTQLILLSGRANNFSAKAPHLADRNDITLIESDIRNVVDIPNEVEWIIHAAGNPDNRLHASDPLRTIQVIVKGTDTILEVATRLPDLKKFLNISSGLVYGSQPWELETIPESFMGSLNCDSIRSAYAEAKRMGETLCAVYRNQHRLPVVNARPFAFIGPYQLLDRPWAINNFIRDSLLGGPIRILGDGETVRSYMYPSDMAWWLLRILVQGTVGASYNVGSPHGVTLQKLAKKIAGHSPVKSEILSGLSSDRSLGRSKFIPDVRLAKNALDLCINVDLDSAIKRTIVWNRNYC